MLLSLKQKHFFVVGITLESKCIGIGALLPGQEQEHIFPDTPALEKYIITEHK